jgi:hypothetical protein
MKKEGKIMARKAVEKEPVSTNVTISAPKLLQAEFTIIGTAPYVQQAMSQKARAQIKGIQEAGSTGKKGKKREPKDFQDCYEQSKHLSKEGWCGIPAGAFRAAMVSACRLVGFKMTLAKLSIFVEADGFDKVDGTPLIKITKGEPHYCEHPVRLKGDVVDLRARPMWDPGWEAKVRITFDADQFTLEDVTNLMMRVGLQVGLGEGRPNSRSSVGMGWGTYKLEGIPMDEIIKKAA